MKKHKETEYRCFRRQDHRHPRYGSQGHAHARNLQDSGHNVIVGLYEGSYLSKVEAAGQSPPDETQTPTSS